jgi:hypothetical protein
VDRFPAKLCAFLGRLRGELWRRNIEEDIGTRRFDVEDLRIDSRSVTS